MAGPPGRALAKKAPPGQTLFFHFLFSGAPTHFSIFSLLENFLGASLRFFEILLPPSISKLFFSTKGYTLSIVCTKPLIYDTL